MRWISSVSMSECVCVCDATEANKTINCKKIRREHQRHALPPHKVCQLIFVDYKNIFILSISFFFPNLLFCCWCCWYRSTVAWILSNIEMELVWRTATAAESRQTSAKNENIVPAGLLRVRCGAFWWEKNCSKAEQRRAKGNIYRYIYIQSTAPFDTSPLFDYACSYFMSREIRLFFFSRFATFLCLPIFLFSFVRFGCCCYIPSGYSDTW